MYPFCGSLRYSLHGSSRRLWHTWGPLHHGTGWTLVGEGHQVGLEVVVRAHVFRCPDSFARRLQRCHGSVPLPKRVHRLPLRVGSLALCLHVSCFLARDTGSSICPMSRATSKTCATGIGGDIRCRDLGLSGAEPGDVTCSPTVVALSRVLWSIHP